MNDSTRFSARKRKLKPGTLVLIALLHLLAFYGLVRAFAPDFTAGVERSVVSAFTVTVSAAPDEPEEPEPEPDEGAAGDPGKEAVPQPVTAPTPRVVVKPDPPAPRASSTGDAVTSGARDQGDGTGAAGSGLGTGSGQGGGGQGGVAPTKPVHISGGIDNARDFPVPEGGRQARRGNEVIVRVIVGTDGRARNCTIYQPSPDAEADRITCALVVERLRFKPATDRQGNPVAAPFYWKQRWF
ncbi:TonB family protein [Allopontixanthobacter sp.]|uniref:TonB family protein n=1 Tax=Allopontixanthobacter sp. TaxID=2906452 RepID=UPI002ABBCEE3|nr:TonB family protein [Allopontixanthobacter sp.]MDZ4307292.1 TonB family protein [Allopontixanthobacter sp.]